MAKTTKTLKKLANKPAAANAPASTPAPQSAQTSKLTPVVAASVAGTPVKATAPTRTNATVSAEAIKPTVSTPTPQPLPATPKVPTSRPVQTPPSPALVANSLSKTAPVKVPPPQGNHILLELLKPDAKSVYVAGSFNEWKPDKTPLSPAGNGRWVGDLAIKPGRHEYLFVVDGQWLPDPNAKESVGNPCGGRNSVLVVSE